MLADKISTNQNSGITVLLSFHFIALVYVPLGAIDNNVLQFYFINNIVFLQKKVCYLFI